MLLGAASIPTALSKTKIDLVVLESKGVGPKKMDKIQLWGLDIIEYNDVIRFLEEETTEIEKD